MKTKQGLLILLAGLSLALCHGCTKKTYKIIDRGILQMQYDSLVKKGKYEVIFSSDGVPIVYSTLDVYTHKAVIDSTNHTYSEMYPKMPLLPFINPDKLKPIQPLENVAVIQLKNDTEERIIISRNNPTDILKAIRNDRFYNSLYNVIHFFAFILGIAIWCFLAFWLEETFDLGGGCMIFMIIIVGALLIFGHLLLDSIIVVLRA